MNKYLLYFLLICSPLLLPAQSGIYAEFIPKANYAYYLPGGLVPGNFWLRTLTPAFSVGFGYSQCIKAKWNIRLGLQINQDRYRTTIWKDKQTEQRLYAIGISQSSTSYTEISNMVCRKWGKQNKVSTGVGLSYNLQPYGVYVQFKSISVSGNDTLIQSTYLLNVPATRFALNLEMARAYKLNNRFTFELSLRAKLAKATRKVHYNIYLYKRTYDFDVMRSPSFIGFSCRLLFNFNPHK